MAGTGGVKVAGELPPFTPSGKESSPFLPPLTVRSSLLDPNCFSHFKLKLAVSGFILPARSVGRLQKLPFMQSHILLIPEHGGSGGDGDRYSLPS